MREETFHAAIASRRAPPANTRFGIYRNNVNAALVNALKVRFPATATILGQDDFASRAFAWSLDNLPASPVLIGYGAGFADALPEPVATVAHLDNLWWQAYHAAEVQPASADFLAMLTPDALFALRFQFHPSMGLFTAEHTAASVWDEARRGVATRFGTDRQHVLVARPEAEVVVTLVSAHSFQFISRLAAGETLGAAAEAMMSTDFDLAAEIAGLLSHRIIIGA